LARRPKAQPKIRRRRPQLRQPARQQSEALNSEASELFAAAKTVHSPSSDDEERMTLRLQRMLSAARN